MQPQWKIWLAVLIGATIIIGLAGVPAAAADRPLTPMGLRIWVCGVRDAQETICGEFRNSEDSKVTIENQIYENGVLTTAGLQFDCDATNSDGARCMYLGFEKVGFGQFQLLGVKWNTTYCISLRTRRVDDGLVSAAWSAPPACVHIPPLPPLPQPPGVAVSYLGAIWSGGKQVPQQVKVTKPPAASQEGWSAAVSFNNQPFSVNDAGWTYTVQDPARLQTDDHLAIQVCLINPAGKNCSSQVVSILGQRVVSGYGYTPPPVKTATALPSQASLFNGYWNVTSNQGGSFMLDLRLIVDGKMGGEMSSAADPTQKGSLHGHQIDTTHSELIFAQPSLSRGGTIDVTVTGNGDTFTGLGQATGGGAITWQGTRTSPPQPVH